MNTYQHMPYRYMRQYTGSLKAVIFDWAGTTVDYGSCAPAGVFVKVFQNMGIQISLNQAREPMGLEKKMHLRTLLMMEEISRKWNQVKGRPWTEDDVEALYREFVPLQLKCLSEYSKLIPGTLEITRELRKRGLNIGSTTGYNSDMIGIVASLAKDQGFEPDAIVSSTDVTSGRPHPWMALECARRLQIYPLESYVKIGDTVADIEEGLNAGMWSIGVTKSGNELGLSLEDVNRLDPQELSKRLSRAQSHLLQAGAHFVVESVNDLVPILDEINRKLAQGEKP